MPKLMEASQRTPRLLEFLGRYPKGPSRRAAMRSVLHMSGTEFIEAFGRDEFTNLMLDASHKSVVEGYRQVSVIWPFVARVVPVPDFKTQNVIAAGAFSDLEKVGEFDEYPLESFVDEKATYSVDKYGKRFAVSLEARVNDELGQLADVVTKFGQAAARTVENFVIGTNLVGNPTIYDGNALFDNTNHANDGSTGGYTRAKLVASIAKFVNQTGRNGEKIAINPSILIVRPEDYIEALEDVTSAQKLASGVATSTSMVGLENAIGRFIKRVETSPYVNTDAFYLLADPNDAEGFRLGFLGGRREPEILREAASSGWSFAHDAEQLKIRHVFGGAWVDWRTVQRNGV